jgi:hypothetical protein
MALDKSCIYMGSSSHNYIYFIEKGLLKYNQGVMDILLGAYKD